MVPVFHESVNEEVKDDETSILNETKVGNSVGVATGNKGAKVSHEIDPIGTPTGDKLVD